MWVLCCKWRIGDGLKASKGGSQLLSQWCECNRSSIPVTWSPQKGSPCCRRIKSKLCSMRKPFAVWWSPFVLQPPFVISPMPTLCSGHSSEQNLLSSLGPGGLPHWHALASLAGVALSHLPLCLSHWSVGSWRAETVLCGSLAWSKVLSGR